MEPSLSVGNQLGSRKSVGWSALVVMLELLMLECVEFVRKPLESKSLKVLWVVAARC
jgi:hypothetical protein